MFFSLLAIHMLMCGKDALVARVQLAACQNPHILFFEAGVQSYGLPAYVCYMTHHKCCGFDIPSFVFRKFLMTHSSLAQFR